MKITKWLALFSLCAVITAGAGCDMVGGGASYGSRPNKTSSEQMESGSSSASLGGGLENAEDGEEDSTDNPDDYEDLFPPGEKEEGIKDWAYDLKADNRYAALDIQNGISTKVGNMSFITKECYRGIKRIAFNAKTGDTVSWWGIAISNEPSSASVYNTDLTTGGGTGRYWSTFVYDFEGTGCTVYATRGDIQPRVLTELKNVPYSSDEAYAIYFVGPLWETFSEFVCIDNFTIELLDGTIYTDTFENDVDDGLFNTDAAVTHVVDTTVEVPKTEQPETVLQETNEVYYTSDEKIDFTAYAPVTVENWAGSGTSNPNLVTDTQYRYMAEAGFTKSLGLYEGRTGDSGYTYNEKAEKDALAVLEVAEKYGIKYYVLNERFYNFVRPDINIEFFDLNKRGDGFYNLQGQLVSATDAYQYLKPNWMDLYREKMSEMFGEDTQYIDSPAFGGNFASDEPPLPQFVETEWVYGELEQLYHQISLYYEYMAENSLYGGEAYVNLLPYGAINPVGRQAYDKMLEYYFENLAPLLGYVCYDQYPLNYSGSAYINNTHLLNLEMMANYCKAYDVELRSFLWAKTASGAGHRPIKEANDLRFQAYANLAYGVKEMPYYTYFNYYAPGANAGDSLIDCQTGYRTKAYYWAKEVNNEIHSFEQAYLNFTWEGSMYFDEGKASKQFALLETTMNSHQRLVDIHANADTLVGVFSDIDGVNGATDGFVVMNYTDPYYEIDGKKENVVLAFADATHVLVYKDGKQYIAELTGGILSMYLEAGEGVFVVPFNK